MMRLLLLLLVTVAAPAFVLAQQPAFQQQYVQLADGSEVQCWISLDQQADLLHFKSAPNGKAEVYHPQEVVSFQWDNMQYYSLPLREGYYTFFRVSHEAAEFAVLEKAPSYKALTVVVEESGGKFSMCQNRRSNELYLCAREYKPASDVVPGIPAPQRSPFTGDLKEFRVNKLIFLAIEGQLKLFYMETDERFNPFDNFMGPKPGKHRINKMLEDFIEDPKKLALIQKKATQEELDIRMPDHLARALQAAYR